MKKIFLSIMCMLALLLSACQGNNSSSTATVSPSVGPTEEVNPSTKPTEEVKPDVKPTEEAKPSTKPTEEVKPDVKPTEEDTYKLKLAGPGGAPAVAISELLHTYKDEYIFNVNLAPKALGPLFSNKENDIIIAPINMGAMQYSKNSNYVLGSVLTWGNLYFASQRPNFKLEDIEGSELIYFGENSVNEAIIKDIFFKKDIKPAILTPLEDTKLTQAKLVSDENAICVVAEPLLSAAMAKKPNITAISIQDLFKEVSGQAGFAQAGAFIKVDTINEHKGVVNKFLTRLEASASFALENPVKAAEYAKELEVNVPAPAKSIPNCNIKYTRSKDARTAIDYLVELNPSYFGGAKPIDSFYYEG